MGSERTVLSVAQDGGPNQAQTPADGPRTPHLDTLRTKRLQFFCKNQSIQNSLEPKRAAAHADGLSNRQVPLDPLRDEAELDPLLLQDSDVPEHQKLRHPSPEPHPFIRPLSQPSPEPRSFPRPLSQPRALSPTPFPAPSPSPALSPTPFPAPFPSLALSPTPFPAPSPSPALSPAPCHSLVKTQGHSEVQLNRKELQDCTEVGRERAGRLRSQYVDSSESRCMNLTGVRRDLYCERGESRRALAASAHPPISILEEIPPKSVSPVIAPADHTTAVLTANTPGNQITAELTANTPADHTTTEANTPADHTTSELTTNTPTNHTTAKLTANTPANHTTAELTANTPANHTTAELTTNTPANHTTAELTANTPASHTTAELTANTPANHTTAELTTNTPANHTTAELPAPAQAEDPVRETHTGLQDGCRSSSEKKQPVEAKKPPGSSWPRRAVSSGSSRRRRFWEKSSMLWSSYAEGTLLPRVKPSARPAVTSCSVAACTPQDSALSSDSSPLKDRICPGTNAPQHHMPGGTVSKPWLSLPDELWMAILKLMSHSDLCHVAQTCHRLCRLANDRTLWQVVRIENSACLNADWLSSIGRRGPCSLTLCRCTDEHVTPRGLEELFAQSGGSLKELRIVNCSGPGLHGNKLLLPCSRYCPRLTNVDVSWTGATDTGIAALASATSRQGPHTAQALSSLTHTSSETHPYAVGWVSPHVALRCHCLMIAYFFPCSLESVVVNGCSITDRVFKIIVKRHGRSLRRLEVFGSRSLSAPCLGLMATCCPNLKVVNLGKLPNVTEACLTFIIGRLKQLTSLDLTGLAVVRDQTVHQIARQCPKLQDLTLRCCPSVTDRSLIEISTYSTSIRFLDVSGCSAVTDLGIQAISKACQGLQYLDLSSTKTSNKGVQVLASYGSRHLHTVKISFCYICQDSLRKLCRYHTGLRLLHLYGACDFHNVQELRLINPSLEMKCDLACLTPPGLPH
ncbi:mucin-2-like [Conger conger]|uniref:mucin-2-like n=1 Tax=Conger conger TaxID=82655 RepID=UPI002A5AED7A|nr:mucin-2-like [Conger conger]